VVVALAIAFESAAAERDRSSGAYPARPVRLILQRARCERLDRSAHWEP
jgi:hypothetical protein